MDRGLQFSVKEITKRVFTPLSEAAAELVSPIRILPTDRLVVMYGDGHFHLKIRSFYNEQWGCASRAAETTFPLRIQPFGIEILHGSAEYKVPATDNIVLLIDALWPREQIVFANDDGDTERVYNAHLLRYAMQSKAMEVRLRWRESKEIADPIIDFLDHDNFPLAPYQKAGAVSSLLQESTALFMEQGTGKTATTIARLCSESKDHYERNGGQLYRCVIVCPKNLRTNWKKEIVKFATVPGRVTIVKGNKFDRIEALIKALNPNAENGEMFTCVIVSYEGLVKSWHSFQLPEWELCILDESHYIKDPNTKRAKVILQLRDRCDRRQILTGTPINNGVKDLYTQLEFLGHGLSGFSSWKKFRQFYEKYEDNEQGRHGDSKVVGFQNLPFLQERLARLAHVVSKKEALPDLPEKMYSIQEIEMTDEQILLYKQVQEQLKVEIADKMFDAESGGVVTINHILTMMMKLAQVTSGFLITDKLVSDDGEPLEDGKIIYLNPNPKISALLDIVKEQEENEKMIVWACFKADIRRICVELEAAGIDYVSFWGETKDADRETAIERFNCDPKCKVFVGNPASAKEGLNLWGYDPTNPSSVTNATKAIYFSQNWSPIARWQSEDRCHRRGTRVHIQYIDLVVPGTIDEEIRRRVVEKKVNADSIQDLKEIAAILFKALEDNAD